MIYEVIVPYNGKATAWCYDNMCEILERYSGRGWFIDMSDESDLACLDRINEKIDAQYWRAFMSIEEVIDACTAENYFSSLGRPRAVEAKTVLKNLLKDLGEWAD
jgi:hypothetical protein